MPVPKKVEALVDAARGEALATIARDRERAPEDLRALMAALAERAFEPLFQVTDLDAMGLLDAATRQRFKTFYGHGVKEYLLERRAEVVKWLLVKTDLAVGMIGKALGYTTPGNLSGDFRRQTGESPTRYRQARRRRARTRDWRDAVATLERAGRGALSPAVLAAYRGGGDARAPLLAQAYWRVPFGKRRPARLHQGDGVEGKVPDASPEGASPQGPRFWGFV